MATTTPNYGWSVPTSTDLVKDGATAIETLGDSVDATVKALNPETTLGDIAYRSSTANTNTRLGIGSTGQVLTVAGGVPTWAAAAASGANWTLLNTGGTALTGASTVTVSGISGKDKVQIVIIDASSNTTDDFISIRFNTDTGNNYNVGTGTGATGEPWNSAGVANTDRIYVGRLESSSASAKVSGSLNVTGCNASGVKMFMHGGSGGNAASSRGYWGGGWYNSASTISSVSVVASNGTLDAGTVYVFTSA
jgi:hypothetical protein